MQTKTRAKEWLLPDEETELTSFSYWRLANGLQKRSLKAQETSAACSSAQQQLKASSCESAEEKSDRS